MFENKTFENILNDMLQYVSDQDSELDIRVGSIIYTALAPIALELEAAYHEMDMILTETFLETASKEYLLKHGNQLGIDIIDATPAHFKGEFDVDVPLNSRFSLGTFTYTVLSKLSEPSEDNSYYIFEVVCETAGTKPNDVLGDLIPITYVENLTHSKLISTVVYGKDEEETEKYRTRIQEHLTHAPFGGNVSQYAAWLNEYPEGGLGKYTITPCWNGHNTVKLTVLNTVNREASGELIKDLQNYFDPANATIDDDINASNYPQGRGMGNGKAPIGAIVTVDTPDEQEIIVDCVLKLKSGYSKPVGVKEGIKEYLSSIALNKNTVAYMPISAEIYNAESVEEVLSLTITVNGIVMDTEVNPFIDSVVIDKNKIPVLNDKDFTWGVRNE